MVVVQLEYPFTHRMYFPYKSNQNKELNGLHVDRKKHGMNNEDLVLFMKHRSPLSMLSLLEIV
jgi:hypothetical protein